MGSMILRRLAVILSFCLMVVAVVAAPVEHVFIISIDGGAPKVIHEARMPVLKQLTEEGAFSWSAQTIRPSLTLPAHTSMLTGVGTNKHNVSWNNWNPTNGMVNVPTIFSAAKSNGLSTAMFVGKEKFRHLALPKTVDEFGYDSTAATFILKSATGKSVKEKEGNVMATTVATNVAKHIVAKKPNLCFIHFTDTDTIGHEFGWGSPEQLLAFEDVDVALGVVMNALREAKIVERSVVIISADHGGHNKGHSKGEPQDMIIPWIAWGAGVKKNFEITESVNTCDTAATALWLLQAKPLMTLDGKLVSSAFEIAETKSAAGGSGGAVGN